MNIFVEITRYSEAQVSAGEVKFTKAFGLTIKRIKQVQKEIRKISDRDVALLQLQVQPMSPIQI